MGTDRVKKDRRDEAGEKDRKRDRSRSTDREHGKSHRSEKDKERRRDRSRDRHRSPERDDKKDKYSRDKKEKSSKDKKDKSTRQLDSLFGEKVELKSLVTGIAIETDGGLVTITSQADLFDAGLGQQFSTAPVSISVGGSKVGLPKDANKYFKNDLGLDATSGALTVTSGGIVGMPIDMTAPMMASETMRNARENRRMHVTGFPRLTPREVIQAVIEQRFTEYRRDIIARDSDKPPSELPQDAECTIDRVLDVFLDNLKEKPFAFVEINTDDMVEMFINPTNVNERPINISLTDGSSATLSFGRPRDFKKLWLCDPTRVLIQGIHPKFDAEKMNQLVAKIAGGNIVDFAMKDGVAFAEFEDETTARKVIEGLNGVPFAKRLLSAQPLTEVMRAFCIQSLGFKIPYKYIPEVEEKHNDNVSSEVRVLMDILKIGNMLPAALCNLHIYHPHLSPILGAVLPVYPTRILVLLNIVDDTDLETEAAYKTLCQSVAEEVEKYGHVETLIVPRHEPPPPPLFVRKQIDRPVLQDALSLIAYEEAVKEQDALEAAYEKAKKEYPQKREEWERTKDHPVYGNTGKIFVVYGTKHEALRAQQGLSGKLYSNRTVVTSFLFEDILWPPTEEPTSGGVS